MDLNFIRLNIKNLRKSEGITQRDMATRLFMDERTYSKVERGEKKSMDITLLASIADILKTDVTSLIQKPQDCPPPPAVEPAIVTAPQHLASREYIELLEEIHTLKLEIREMIACHKEALEILKVES